MSASLSEHTQSNAAEIPDPTEANNPESNPLDLNAPYQHTLPKDSDPWTTLLKPELKADTQRCNAWKDEVQNLLIFAGLFSAVVTAFVIESYKFLQPDPNDAIVGLLFHIASGLNNTSPFPPSVIPGPILTPFSQAPSATRINVFWFISLILSLTTVLVGTIALQWLREHQSYDGYSSKEKLAMLHMRSQAIEAWYLPQVFAALPLLLQAALALFLAGLVDFSFSLGLKLAVPVSIIVGLTLLFLTATTILPSLQGLSFFCGLYPRKIVPTPCPFKSPQSHAFRALFRVVLCTIFRRFPPPHPTWDNDIISRSLLVSDHLAPAVYDLWYPSTWPTLDRAWLSLRDSCHQRIFDHDLDLYHHRTQWDDSFPLSDVTQYLVEAVNQTPGFKHTHSFLVALVHCFNELAESIWTVPDTRYYQTTKRMDRRSNYFEQLLSRHSSSWSCSLPNFILHGGVYIFGQLDEDRLVDYMKGPEVKRWLFHTDLTIIYISMLLKRHTSRPLAWYCQDLWGQALQVGANVALLTPTITHGSESIPIPTILKESTIQAILQSNLAPEEQFSTAASMLYAIFESAASHCVPQDQSMDFLCAHKRMCEVLDLLALRTDDFVEWAQIDTPTKQHVLQDIGDQFVKLFNFIRNHLNEERSDLSANSGQALSDILFYLSSIFVQLILRENLTRRFFKNQDSAVGLALGSLLDTLHKVWTSGQKSTLIEERFWTVDLKTVDREIKELARFSRRWWRELFENVTVHVTEQVPHIGPASNEGRYPDPRPNASSQLAIPSTEEAISPMPATSPGTLDHSPASKTHNIDDQLATAHLASLPEISASQPSSNLVNHAEGCVPDSPSDLPAMLNHPATSTKGTDTINNLPLSHLRSSSDEPDDTHPLSEDHTASRIAALSVSLPLISPTAAGLDGVVPQKVTRNGTSHSDEHNLQPRELHLAIVIEPPAGLERVGDEIPGFGSNHSLDEAQPKDGFIRIEESSN